MKPLLTLTERGLYCPDGDFHIDPSRPVERAVVTHAHSDHARPGSKQYYTPASGVRLLKARLGEKIRIDGSFYGEPLRFGEVELSFHPAGHILGSSQVAIRRGSETWVVSGDYKRDPDPTCEPFEVVPCDVFVTEATFGAPSYAWEKDRDLGLEMFSWWQENAAQGRNSLIYGYSLGKIQRILGELARYAAEPVWIHESAVRITECYREEGVKLAPTRPLSEWKGSLKGQLILAPPGGSRGSSLPDLGRCETAFASGWMQTGAGGARGGDFDRGFVISDHADWPDLIRTVQETGARKVYVMHSGNGQFVRHLRKLGLEAFPVSSLLPEFQDPGSADAGLEQAEGNRVHAVILYAQPDPEAEDDRFRKFGVALWHEGSLLQVAQVSGGLSEEEIAELDFWVRKNTLERFGPARSVRPVHVLEIEFDSVGKSPRAKAGITLDGPRVTRWLREKTAREAHRLASLRGQQAEPTLF